jgi:drug/metabolite transporter (DMT)-like permease
MSAVCLSLFESGGAVPAMTLAVAIPCALAAAIAYGASTAVEHSAAHKIDDEPGRGLLRLLRDPRWLIGMLGDTVGLVLQVIALATGPVSLVQPVLVLALPVSLPIAWWLGGPRPGRREALACGYMIAGLAVFFVILGNPGPSDPLAARPAVIAWVVLVVVGTAALAAVRLRARPLKAAVYGTVAGAWFGLVAVLMDAATDAWQRDGIAAFTRMSGLLPLALLLPLGAASIAVTQVSFQIGDLGASFPANLAADPVVAVFLGAVLLHQNVPAAIGDLIAYAACLAAVLYGAIQLARGPAYQAAAP